MDENSVQEPLLLSEISVKKTSLFVSSVKWILKILMWAIFVAWIGVIFLFPTQFGNGLLEKYIHATSGNPCGITGSLFLVLSGPVLVIAFLSIFHLIISGDEEFQQKKSSKNPGVRLWTFPVLVDGPLGVVSAAEFIGILLFVVYVIWALYAYVFQSLNRISGEDLTLMEGRIMFLKMMGGHLGSMGLFCMAFLFLPVARGSVLLRFINIPFEHATRYHVWLGHLTMVLFTLHGLLYIVGWAMEGNLLQKLLSWKDIGVAILPGVISLFAGLLMWVTSLPPVRKWNFELFFYTHQLYVVFVLGLALHVGDFIFSMAAGGIFLFMLDRFLRLCQSRRTVDIISAKSLPCGTVELVLSKPGNLRYNALSFVFLQIRELSWLQWHPFSVSSSPLDGKYHLSILIKVLGEWTARLRGSIMDISEAEQPASPSQPRPKLTASVEGPYGHDTDASVKDLGDELQKLTDIKADTMRLIVPRFSNKSSKLLFPFSDEHSQLSLQEASIMEGKFIRMLGVSEDEVDKVLQNAKVDLRIAGFDEEEKRMRQRMSDRPRGFLKLPQGPYIFCDFRTLQIPGVELNPPASEALKRMHMLAADPGIVAIMNKHRWRVGIMTEMAPVGYVGVSPKCILGFNKNHGEEISLRLRTDDLKGFRKYESIKKTLLHELAHMLYSEHDANFYALDKQLNEEAASLDWTKSRGHTLSGVNHQDQDSEDFYVSDSRSSSVKLGGNVSNQLASARASSVAAAYHRLADASSNSLGASEAREEPDPDDSIFNMHKEPGAKGQVEKGKLDIENQHKSQWKPHHQPDPDEHPYNQNKNEPDPDDSQDNHHEVMDILNIGIYPAKTIDKPDPDDSQGNHHETMDILNIGICPGKTIDEPDPDDSQGNHLTLNGGICPDKTIDEPDPDDCLVTENIEDHLHLKKAYKEPDPDESETNQVVQAEPDPDDDLAASHEVSRMQIDEPDPDDEELRRIQDPVSVICSRLQKATETLRAELKSTEATAALQTLFKIIRNVIEHPDQSKFKRLRKANPIIQKHVASHQAAVEIVHVVGFSEEVSYDETGKADTYLVLKRNDPGLLWLAKSTLEACMA